MSVKPFFDSERLSNLPVGLQTYKYQVGGHGSLAKSAEYKMLRHPREPIVYKKLPKDRRGVHESNFYLKVFADNAPPEVAKLRPVVPLFYGLFQRPNTEDVYLGLEDVLSDLVNPSVCDLKMGRVACPPDASEEKIRAENAKYAHRDTVGFLLTGMKIYERESGRYLTVPRYYGRGLDPESVYLHGLLPFLQGDLQLAQAFLPCVETVRSVFVDEPQPPLGIYCSSLLLAYDQNRATVVARLVDFAHWRPTSEITDPSGIVHGLTTLVDFLRRPEVPSDFVYSAPFSVAE